MNAEPDSGLPADARKGVLEKRLEELSWAIFLIMTGIIWLMPDDRVPGGTWLIGTGLLLLGFNVARYLNGMTIGGFTTVLGALALAGGLGEFFGAEVPILAFALIIFGASIVVKPFLVGRK